MEKFTEYGVLVRGKTQIGWGEPAMIMATTQEDLPSDFPRDIQVSKLVFMLTNNVFDNTMDSKN